MARQRIYADNAERQAAYNERLREKERQRQAAITLENQRRDALRQRASQIAGQIVARMLSGNPAELDRLGIAFGDTPEEAREMREMVRRLSQPLIWDRVNVLYRRDTES